MCLRDPATQQASSFKDLLHLFCNREDTRATEISTICSYYFIQNGGKNLAFLFDGLDEYPEALLNQKNNLITGILKRDILPCSSLIVSSRPHATVHLRNRVTVSVDILGFTEREQNHFIQNSLKEQPQSIKELNQYLKHHFTIRNLCVVPFNLVVLLFLYKNGISLPNNSTELYNHFICITICRHLAKCGYPLNNTITDLTNLPNPYKKITQQLSRFSLEALTSNQLVFTFNDIIRFCPNIEAIPGAINGFGLMQAVKHFGLTGKTVTFNFLHFSIQEILAAHYVSCLPASDELKFLEENFGNKTYSNMFNIYITLTKGQSPSFKQFIKPSLGQQIMDYFKGSGAKLANQFVEDKVKCFRLFQCFYEVDDREICKSIENSDTFNNKVIRFNDQNISEYVKLLPSDVECMTIFLTCSSHKKWQELALYRCYIQDHGIRILHHGLTSSTNITIKTLQLWHNGLTEYSSSAIRDITIKCKVKKLHISNNNGVGEDEALYSILSDPYSVLEELHMNWTKLSSSGAIKLFDRLSNSKKLQTLQIADNDVTDEACNAIVTAMKKNTSLLKLIMNNNPIGGECAERIVKALQQNSTLQQLWLPNKYTESIKERIRLSAENINKERESNGFEMKLYIEFFST